MNRIFLPSILATLGFFMVVWAIDPARSLFEWQIKNISTDFPLAYEVHTSPGTLTTNLGKSLSNNSYYEKVYVTKDGEICAQSYVKFNAKRSRKSEALERAFLNIDERLNILYEWGLIETILCGIYIWVFTIWARCPLDDAISSTFVAGLVFFSSSQIVRPFLYKIGTVSSSFGYTGILCDQGVVTFNVMLSKIHYEIPIVWLMGILFELGALAVILQQVIKATKDQSAESAVG